MNRYCVAGWVLLWAACSDSGSEPIADASVPGDGKSVGAWIATEGDIPEDRTGLARVEPGDIVMQNDRIGVIIEDAAPSDLYDPFGGKPVALYVLRDGERLPGDFNEIIPAIGRFVLAPEKVEITHDGSDGEPIVVRAEGRTHHVPFINDFAKALFPKDHEMDAAMEYVLAPDSDHVDVYWVVDNRGRPAETLKDLTTLIFQRERMPEFSGPAGFAFDASPPYLAFVDDLGASYAWRSPHGDLAQPVPAQAGFNLLTLPEAELEEDAETRFPVAQLVIGGPGLDGLVQALARSDGDALRRITGSVVDPDGEPVAGAWIHVENGEDYLTRARSDSDGRFTLHVPEDAEVALTAHEQGRQLVEAEVGSGSEAELKLPAVGWIEVEAVEANSKTPLPVRIQVSPETLKTVPEHFGERLPGAERMHLVYALDGRTTLQVPPGVHRVVISRGYEYELHVEEVMVTAGETTRIEAALERSVDTPGVMCMDAHIHTNRSPDSPDDGLLKVSAAAAEGVEIPVRTDHEWVRTFQAEVEELGLQKWVFGMGGEELTTFEWGHFGVFPLTPNEAELNDGAIPWADRSPAEVFDAVRARPEDPLLIINHPRGGMGLLGPRSNYFDAVDYDPKTGEVGNMELWSEDFSIIEVFNGTDFESVRDADAADWFSFLQQGKHTFAVGASDTHYLTSDPLGYPRTCLRLGTDDPRDPSADEVAAAVRAGHGFVSGGIYIEAALARDGTGSGEVADGLGAAAAVEVKVQAPSWVEVNRLEVIVDGITVETFELPASDTATRFDEQVDVPVAPAGSWVVFHAAGDTDLFPVHPDEMPFAVTNPIFLAR